MCISLGTGSLAASSAGRPTDGLQHRYSFHLYCCQLLALPCLPWELIGITLKDMTSEATMDAQQQLCSYMQSTWIDSTVWPPASRSVFNRCIRSNNDVEGWHRRLNMKAARGQLNMYLLIELLASEAVLVDLQVTLLKESTIVRRQRKASRTAFAHLFHIWERLVVKKRTVSQTLRAAAYIMESWQ